MNPDHHGQRVFLVLVLLDVRSEHVEGQAILASKALGLRADVSELIRLKESFELRVRLRRGPSKCSHRRRSVRDSEVRLYAEHLHSLDGSGCGDNGGASGRSYYRSKGG